jgi:hypothetical protein
MSRCTRSDGTNDDGQPIGCIKQTGHMGRCTVRVDPGPRHEEWLARNEEWLGGQDAPGDSDGDEATDAETTEESEATEEAEVQWGVAYDACIALGMTHLRLGDADCFVNPHNGRVVQVTAGSLVRRCEIRPV